MALLCHIQSYDTMVKPQLHGTYNERTTPIQAHIGMYIVMGDNMKSRYLKFILCTLIFMTSGCTTLGEKFTPAPVPPNDKSLVYLFRSNVGYGNFWITNFLVDGKEIVSLYDKGYTWIHLSEGKHSIEANTPTQSELKIVANTIAGKTYYIEYTQESAGYNHVRNVVRVVPSTMGKDIVKEYSYKKSDLN